MKEKDRHSYHPRTKIEQYPLKALELLFGLTLFAVGSYMTVQANIGLAPWWAFAVGLSNVTGIAYGTMSIVIGVAIMFIDIAFHEKIGWGMVGDAIVIGAEVDLFDAMGIIPPIKTYWVGIIIMLMGLLIIAIGSYFYMDAAFGCGPRDAMMVAFCRILNKLPVGAVRVLIEGTAFLIGFLLGAKAGLGTLIYTFGIGIFVEIVFRITKFDVTKVCHESLIDTHSGIEKCLQTRHN